MKGVVFREFIALVEETYGLEKLEGWNGYTLTDTKTQVFCNNK